MKLQEALRKVIRQFGVSVIQEKRLMSFLADYRAFDDYPAVREVMKAIATGECGKDLCRYATEESDDEYLKFADSLKESLASEKSFKQEFADYAVDSISFALGIASSVTEPGDNGFEAVQKNAGGQGRRRAQSGSGAQGGGSTPGGTSQCQAPSQRRRRGLSGVFASVPDGAGSHRRFYRGEDITAAFDDGSFSTSVADGTFYDIFPGDYIRKKITVPAVANTETSTYEVKFVIADLDIAMNQGSPRVTAHHAVIVPEEPVFYTYMNPTDTNKGGYAGSYMHKTVMPAFALGLIGAFGTEHLLKCSFDGSGRTSDPLACTCRLMTLSMVFGQAELPSNGWDWSNYIKDKCMGGEQLTAFSLHPELRGQNMWYWVSDSSSSSSSLFALVYDYVDGVDASAHDASNACGVRPFALLV
ncbi:MAG: hypothetical protein SOW06_05370 [Succinivibrionaceae bacterium]|nr:hypothetical protein [Succinivibrionaceae bacterium]